MEPLRLWIIKVILSKNNKTGEATIPNFKIYSKALLLKSGWHWHKNWHTDQWKREPRYKSMIYSGWFLIKMLSSINAAGETGYSYAEGWNLTPNSHHVQKSIQINCNTQNYGTKGGKHFKVFLREIGDLSNDFFIWAHSSSNKSKAW
jgi:hypothetical protein